VQEKILAVIPARGGSKRLPRKNLLPLNGKPLIEWTIIASLNSNIINRVIVSSEDEEILEISRIAGVETIARPIHLSNDNSTSVSVVKNVLENLKEEYSFVILLQPTSPLRNSKHIDDAFKLLFEKDADAIISVCKTHHSPIWSNVLPSTLNMSNFIEKKYHNIQSQELPKYYSLNGAIYICRTKRLLSENTFFINDKIYAFIMDRKFSVDIDDLIDFDIAETILRKNEK